MLRGPLLLGRSSLPFASRQMHKMSRGSFDQALWPQAFLVRALNPAVCLHGPLLLGRSSLPFASRQMPKMFRGSFHPALRPLPSVVKGVRNSFRIFFLSRFGNFFGCLGWYHLPSVCNGLELEFVILHGICHIWACSPSILHGIYYMWVCSPSILYGICHILACSPSILHGMFYM